MIFPINISRPNGIGPNGNRSRSNGIRPNGNESKQLLIIIS